MIFSDLHLSRELKIEILPTDFLNQAKDILCLGDQLTTVFRPVGSPFVAQYLNSFFLNEFQANYHELDLFQEALKETIRAFNQSCLLHSVDQPVESGAMVLAVYLSADKVITFAQVGDITLKQKKGRHFTALTQNHTFKNQIEIDQLLKTDFYRKNYLREQKSTVVDYLIKAQKLSSLNSQESFDNISSRFIGHPNWCGLDGETFINTRPYLRTIQPKN